MPYSPLIALVFVGILLGLGIYSSRGLYEASSDNKTSVLPLLLTIAVGAYLRISELNFGLPYTFHPDEIRKAQIVARMLSSWDFNPHYFLHPSLLLYLTSIVDYLFFNSTYEGAFISGRLVSALSGIATILVTYKIGRYLFSDRVGISSASLISVFPLSVTCSRYFKEDSLFTLLSLLGVYYLLKAYYEKRSVDLRLAAFFIGVSVSAKYTAGVLAFFYVALIGATSIWFLPYIILGFILFTPYSVIDSVEFLNGVLYEGRHVLKGHTESISAWSQYWMYHFTRSILPGMTVVPACLSVAAIGASLKNQKALVLIVLGFSFYALAELSNSKPPPQPERYVLPCLPFLAIILSVLVHKFQERVKFILITLLIFLPLERSYSLLNDITPDTRIIAKKWIETTIPKGSRILLDFLPYAPPLSANDYHLVNNPLEPIVPYLSSEKLRSLRVEYIVLSSLSYDRFFSQPSDNVAVRGLYRRLFGRYSIATFESRQGTYGFHNPKILIIKLGLVG